MLEWDEIHRGRNFAFGSDDARVECEINGIFAECEFVNAQNAMITRNFGAK